MHDPDHRYGSMEAFYRAAYVETLVEVSTPVAHGATLIRARQGKGDYSDAAVPDLVITRGLSRCIPSTLDLGAGRFRAAMPRNAMVVTPPVTPTTILLDRPNEVEFLAVPFASLKALCTGHDLPADGDFGQAHGSELACPRLLAAFVDTAREIRAGNPHGALFIEGALMQIAGLLMAHAHRAPRVPRGVLAPWQLARVSDHLRAQLAGPVSLADLAGLVGLSVFHFARAFKASTGLAPHQFQIALRMEQARHLLARTEQSVTDVAFSLGYDSSQSFARAFRITHRTTPTLYRRARRTGGHAGRTVAGEGRQDPRPA